jgi:uncharacterized protein (DUF924 family)
MRSSAPFSGGPNVKVACAVATELLTCWFEDSLSSPAAARRFMNRCFNHHPEFDRELAARFDTLPERVLAGDFAHWRSEPATALAALLALDQLPRNLYRGTPRAFAYDHAALELARHAHAAGWPDALHPLAGAFFNLPFEHAEDLELQRRSVAGYTHQQSRADPGFAELLGDWVVAGRDHLEVIERFGRFPHRNPILGRESTPEELAWLANGGKHWGQVAVTDAP